MSLPLARRGMEAVVRLGVGQGSLFFLTAFP